MSDASGRSGDASGGSLERGECLRHLATSGHGRLAVTSGALPVILPVEIRLSGDHIQIRCREDSTVFERACDHVVAFETDGVDTTDAGDQRWSVAVTGIARRQADNEEWLLGISLERVSGQELGSAWDQLP